MKDWEDIIKERQEGRKADLPESDWNDFLSRRAAHECATKKRHRILALSLSIPAAAAILLLFILQPFKTVSPDNLLAQNSSEQPASAVVAKVQTVKVNDSVMFNVAAFKSPEGTSVEELIRKLPGAQIDSIGNITVNGKAITKILVNGKPYFNDDIIHEYVDLGLSVKWATCNVGADNPEEVGGLYAWGDTETKLNYSYSTYKFCVDGVRGNYTKYCSDDNKAVLDLEDDVAHVKWGGSWRMPTGAEMDELRRECKWTWTEENGVKGYRVSGKKEGFENNTIFLPVNAFNDSAAIARGQYPEYGLYWSSSLSHDAASFLMGGWDHANGFWFCRDATMGNGSYRNEGRSIRPVCP